ncbi:hypothetical protein [Leifsonia sp. NPDC058230]|uniref:hypothetical protein n=1 Tax=Leifsonia sp. NPDC058230 TaxID=3346391 RepID=UPI0036D88CB3
MRGRPFLLVALFAAAIVAVSGCTATASVHRAGEATSAAADASVGATYSAADLSRLLDRASVKLGVTGQLVGDAELKDAARELGGAEGLGRLLGDPGVTFSSASCGTLIRDALSAGTPKDTIAAQLTAGSSSITVAANDGEPLSPAQKSSWIEPLDTMLSECPHLTIDFDLAGKKTTADMTMKKVATSTTADSTVGVVQTMTFALDGATVAAVNTVVQAVSGNLFVTVMNTRTNQATEWAGTDAPLDPVDAVNAVVESAD